MSAVEQGQEEELDVLSEVSEKIDLIEPTTGKLFFEHKAELTFCKPHLMPLKSLALQRLDELQQETARQLQQKQKDSQQTTEEEDNQKKSETR